MSMKDLLNKMTELQGSDTSTGKQVLTENTSVTDYNPKSQGGTRKELLAKYANSKDPKDAESARKAGATQTELKKAKDEVVESAKPSLKNIFNTMLSEAEQVDEKYMGFEKVKAAAKKGGAEDPGAVAASIGRKKYGKEKFQKAAAAGKKLSEAEQITIQPAKQNTQVIKQGQKTLGTVENPQLAQQIKQSIGKGEMTLAGDELEEGDVIPFRRPANKSQTPAADWHQVPKHILDLANEWYWMDFATGSYDAVTDPNKSDEKTLQYQTALLKQKGWSIDIDDNYENIVLISKDGKRILLPIEDAQDSTGWASEVGALNEKWGTETKVAPSEKGKYEGKTKAELLKQYNALKAKGPHKKGSPDYGKMRELAFAIRAKSDWGKVDETKHKGLPDKKDISEALTQSTSNKTDQDYKKLGVKFVRNKKAPWYFSGSGVSDPVGTYVPSDKQSSPEMHKLAADSFKNTINIIKGMIRSNNDQSKIDMFNKWVDFYKQKAEHHRLSATKKTDEAAMPTHDGDFGAGRNSKTLESKKAKPDYIDLDKDGNKKESMKKAAADKQKVSTMKKTNENMINELSPNLYRSAADAAARRVKEIPDKNSPVYATLAAKQKRFDGARQQAHWRDHFRDEQNKELANLSEPQKRKFFNSLDNSDYTMRYFEKIGTPAARREFIQKYITNPEVLNKLVPNNKEMANEAKAKPDYIDLDKDGNKTEPMKKAAADKKKKAVKEGANPTEAARLLGKAHALGKDPFACKYEQGSPEAQAYLAGYKEGLDECYGSGSSDMGQDQMPAVIPGMDAMGMAPADNDFEEDVLVGKTTYGGDTDNFGFDDYEDEETMMAFESWDRQLNALLNEGKMKDIDLDMKELSDAQFKKDHGMTKSQMQKSLTSDDKKDKKTVKEGVTVAINKDIENAPDSVTVTAQGDEADQLLALIKQAGMGLFGGDDQQATGSYGAPVAADTNTPALGDVGDHDSMMALIQKMTAGAQDYADEESQDDEHVHGHPDAACDTCGSAACECDSAGTAMVVGEEETEYQMEFQVAEEADSEEAETTADEDAEAEEDKALAGADSKDEEEIDEEKELTEWANDANNQRTEDDSYYEDIEFMTKVISGGLNNQKQDQTTLPHTKVTVDDLTDWKKLSGIK